MLKRQYQELAHEFICGTCSELSAHQLEVLQHYIEIELLTRINRLELIESKNNVPT